MGPMRESLVGKTWRTIESNGCDINDSVYTGNGILMMLLTGEAKSLRNDMLISVLLN